MSTTGMHYITDQLLLRMEGILSDLRGTVAEQRPRTLTNEFLAHQLNVPPPQVKRWYDQSLQRRAKNASADRFCELWDLIASLLSEHIEAVTIAVACDKGNRQQLAAAKWLLPKINPAMFGERGDLANNEDSPFGEYSQGVFDVMNEIELQELVELQKQIDGLMARGQVIMRRCAARYAQTQSIEDAEDEGGAKAMH